MPTRQSIIAAALLTFVGNVAYAQNEASPPQAQTAPRQGPGMMGTGQMMGWGGGMMEMAPEQQAATDRGIIGIAPALSAAAVGASARLIVRSVAPYGPAYYAGIEAGDQIVAVDGQPIDGKALGDVAAAIRGEVGTPVKLSLSRQDQSREVVLTRVAPMSEHRGHHMSGHGPYMMGGMQNGGMMGGRNQNGSSDENDGKNGMMAMMEQMGLMMDTCNDMMQSRNQPPSSQVSKPAQPAPKN
jgi:membrane-associated protease RseP (regulator of RpoE activity)